MQLEFHQLDRRWEHLRVRRPDRQRRLLASLAASGQQTPIVVVAGGKEPERYLVIDGYKRIAALEQLGRDTVEAVVWPMTEAEALVLERSMRLSEHETALEEGWLLAELEQRFGYGLEDLARRFDRSVSWVSRRLALVELIPESIQEQVRTGRISAHIATKFLVPVARVSLEDCQRMAQAFVRHKCNTRQAGQLYTAWRQGSRIVRQRILEQPELFLKTRRQAEPDPPSEPATELLHDLEMVVAITNRAGRRMARAAAEMCESQREEARRMIDRAIDQLGQLAERIKEEEEHVEQRTADSDSGAGCSGGAQTRDRASFASIACNSAQSSSIELFGGAPGKPFGESGTLPATDPRALKLLQGESGPGP
jgi:ParB family chromosome partitioning protein